MKIYCIKKYSSKSYLTVGSEDSHCETVAYALTEKAIKKIFRKLVDDEKEWLKHYESSPEVANKDRSESEWSFNYSNTFGKTTWNFTNIYISKIEIGLF